MRDEELAAALAALPGWQQERHAVRRAYGFHDLTEARRFVRRLIDLALADEITPHLTWDGGQVLVALGRETGVGRAEIEFARKVDGA